MCVCVCVWVNKQQKQTNKKKQEKTQHVETIFQHFKQDEYDGRIRNIRTCVGSFSHTCRSTTAVVAATATATASCGCTRTSGGC